MHRILTGPSTDQPLPALVGGLAAVLDRRGVPFTVVAVATPGAGPLWVYGDAPVPSGCDERRFGGGHGGTVERCLGPFPDLDALPITTWNGFGEVGPAVRLMAGRGDERVRSVGHVLREVVYLAETHRVGHLMFDDEDLGRYPGWVDAFGAELPHLPWKLSWEATIGGRRLHRP